MQRFMPQTPKQLSSRLPELSAFSLVLLIAHVWIRLNFCTGCDMKWTGFPGDQHADNTFAKHSTTQCYKKRVTLETKLGWANGRMRSNSGDDAFKSEFCAVSHHTRTVMWWADRTVHGRNGAGQFQTLRKGSHLNWGSCILLKITSVQRPTPKK